MLMDRSLIEIDPVILDLLLHLLARGALSRCYRWLGVDGADVHGGGVV